MIKDVVANRKWLFCWDALHLIITLQGKYQKEYGGNIFSLWWYKQFGIERFSFLSSRGKINDNNNNTNGKNILTSHRYNDRGKWSRWLVDTHKEMCTHLQGGDICCDFIETVN